MLDPNQVTLMSKYITDMILERLMTELGRRNWVLGLNQLQALKKKIRTEVTARVSVMAWKKFDDIVSEIMEEFDIDKILNDL